MKEGIFFDHAGKEHYGSRVNLQPPTAVLCNSPFYASVGVYASLAAVMSAIELLYNTAVR